MSQPACLDEDLLMDPIKSFIEIAPRSFRPHCSPHWNLFSIDFVEDELARDSGSVGGLHSGSTFFAPSCNLTPDHALISALISALTPAPVPINKLFKHFMKAYLESNQGPRQPLAERKQIFKAKVPVVYYGKLHMDCYYFCQ